MLQNGTADVYATPNASLISTSKETFFKTRIGCMLTLLVLTVISNVLMSAPFESFGLNGASSFILSISMLICSIWWLELDAKNI